MLKNIKCVLIAIFFAFSLGASAGESKCLETLPKGNLTRNQASNFESDVDISRMPATGQTAESDRELQRERDRQFMVDVASGVGSMVFVLIVALITSTK